jgi:hypothetical protein
VRFPDNRTESVTSAPDRRHQVPHVVTGDAAVVARKRSASRRW